MSPSDSEGELESAPIDLKPSSPSASSPSPSSSSGSPLPPPKKKAKGPTGVPKPKAPPRTPAKRGVGSSKVIPSKATSSKPPPQPKTQTSKPSQPKKKAPQKSKPSAPLPKFQNLLFLLLHPNLQSHPLKLQNHHFPLLLNLQSLHFLLPLNPPNSNPGQKFRSKEAHSIPFQRCRSLSKLLPFPPPKEILLFLSPYPLSPNLLPPPFLNLFLPFLLFLP